MRRFKIGRRLSLSFIIILGFMFFSALYSAVMMISMLNNVENMFKNNVTPLHYLGGASADTKLLMARSMHIFLIRDDAEYYAESVAEMRILQRTIEDFITEYGRILENDPNALQSNVALFNQAVGLWAQFTNMIDTLINYIDAGNDEAAQLFFTDQSLLGVPFTLSYLLSELFYQNIQLSSDTYDRHRQSTRTTITVLITAAATSLVVSMIIARLLIRSITVPINELKSAMDKVADGDLNVNVSTNTTDEIGDLFKDTREVIDTVNNIIYGINKLAVENKDKGNLHARIDTSSFHGSYLTVAESINSLADTFEEDTMNLLDAIQDLGHGNFNVQFPKMPGEKIIINEAIDSMCANLKSVTSEMNMLVTDASKGDLSTRINADLYQGDWANMAQKLNELMITIFKPIHEVYLVMNQVSVGNFHVEVTGDYQGEFLGIKNAVNGTVTNIASYILEISDVLSHISDKDLNASITREYVGEFSAIKDSINDITDNLSNIIQEMSASAHNVASGAKQISDSSTEMASGATAQATSVEEMNSTLFIINESTSKNADNSKEAEILSKNCKDNAVRGNSNMANMLTSMEGIKTSSDNIANIIKVIDNIAFQTNLLALNAAVEAARAGVHGKGFAVVADEVRNLANRSQNAARETSVLINESIEKVSEGSRIVTETASDLEVIVNDIEKLSDIIAEISSSSKEQEVAIGHTTEGISQVAKVMQDSLGTSEASAAAAEELSSQADILEQLVDEFKLKR